ncbi:MAG: DUF4190 domain-containing protein, partial [Micrococcales bacterium]|nr:DUF4190 domain-containing protein [Micrococcales bacterium]
RLREAVRAARQDLSEQPDAPVAVAVGGHETCVTITRDEYDAVIARPMAEIGALAAEALTRSGTTDLARLYLTGGVAHTPELARVLHKVTGILAAPLGDPKLAVALGALNTPEGVLRPVEYAAVPELAAPVEGLARPSPTVHGRTTNDQATAEAGALPTPVEDLARRTTNFQTAAQAPGTLPTPVDLARPSPSPHGRTTNDQASTAGALNAPPTPAEKAQPTTEQAASTAVLDAAPKTVPFPAAKAVPPRPTPMRPVYYPPGPAYFPLVPYRWLPTSTTGPKVLTFFGVFFLALGIAAIVVGLTFWNEYLTALDKGTGLGVVDHVGSGEAAVVSLDAKTRYTIAVFGSDSKYDGDEPSVTGPQDNDITVSRGSGDTWSFKTVEAGAYRVAAPQLASGDLLVVQTTPGKVAQGFVLLFVGGVLGLIGGGLALGGVGWWRERRRNARGPSPPSNAMATASMVTGIASWLCIVTGVVAVGLGIAALVQIRRRGQRGRWKAITGIVTGTPMLVYSVYWISTHFLLS